MKRKKILIAGGVLGAVGLIALILLSGILVKPLLEYAIRDSGFPKANIESVAIIPNGLLLENIYLDEDGFSTIDAVQVTGSWFNLIFRKRVNALTVKNAALSGEINDEGQYVIAGWNGSLLNEDSSGGLTVENVNVTGLTLDFETPEGAIRTEGKLTLQSAQDGSRDFQATIWGKQKQLSLMLTATGKILPEGQWSASVEMNDGRLDMAGFKATRSSGWVALKGGGGTPLSYSGQFSAGGLRIHEIPFQDMNVTFDSSKPEMLQFKTTPTGYSDVIVSGRVLAGTPPIVEIAMNVKTMEDVASLFSLEKTDLAWLEDVDPFEIKLSAYLTSLSAPQLAARWNVVAGEARQPFTGTVMLDRARHLISGQIAAATIQGESLSKLLPLKKKTGIAVQSGTLTIGGTFAHDYEQLPAQVTGSLSLKAENLGGIWQDYPYEGVNGVVQLTRLLPWETAKNQVVGIKIIGTGVNLTDGKIQFHGAQDSGYAINQAAFGFAGGTLSTPPFVWKPNGKNNSLTLQLKEISLARLAESIDASGFTAQGTLEGSLPVIFSPKGLVFKSGTIKSSGDGVFRYSPRSYPSVLRGDDTRMETVRKALSDFHYNNLEVSIGGAVNGDLKTTLKASGTNPIFGTRPINLNINLEGALVPALQQALQPARIGDSIEKSIVGEQE